MIQQQQGDYFNPLIFQANKKFPGGFIVLGVTEEGNVDRITNFLTEAGTIAIHKYMEELTKIHQALLERDLLKSVGIIPEDDDSCPDCGGECGEEDQDTLMDE